MTHCWVLRSLPLVLVGVLALGCSRSKPAATVTEEKPRQESELARTTLTPRAVRSLQIRSEAIARRWVQEQTPWTGWIMARQGNEVTITAPAAGYIRAFGRETTAGVKSALPFGSRLNEGGSSPVAGLPVRQGQELYELEPVLAPVDQIQLAALRRGVEGESAKARASLEAAEAELKRVTELTKEGLRGQQDVEQAKARRRHAQEDQKAAEDKLKLFSSDAPEGQARLRSFVIRAPRAGTVLTVNVSPGQYVPAAAPLVTIADLSELWVRVPIPESELARLDRRRDATVLLRGNQNAGASPRLVFHARPVAVVPLVDVARHTADILYELTPYPREELARTAAITVTAWAGPAIDGLPRLARGLAPLPERTFFARDQMVTVLVPFDERRQEFVVPYSAIVFDAYSNAWLYVDQSKIAAKTHVYERRRVELGARVGEGVVVRGALKDGERVVTSGAGAIYSREFHRPPVAAGTAKEVDDDD